MQNEIIDFLKSSDHLAAYLSGYNIPLDRWGKDGKKSVGELYEELKGGDCVLTIENGVVRCTWPLFIDVIYTDQGINYKCVETQNKKGKRRNLPGTYAEKRLAGENIQTSIARTFREEILPSLPKSGISLNNHSLTRGNQWEEITEAHSYPGLKNKSLNTLFSLIPLPNQGTPKDFTLVESNGTSQFSWIQV